jgi:hypothetical protein
MIARPGVWKALLADEVSNSKMRYVCRDGSKMKVKNDDATTS